MSRISFLLVGLLSLLHLTIMALEMFGKPTSQAQNLALPLDFVKQPHAARRSAGLGWRSRENNHQMQSNQGAKKSEPLAYLRCQW